MIVSFWKATQCCNDYLRAEISSTHPWPAWGSDRVVHPGQDDRWLKLWCYRSQAKASGVCSFTVWTLLKDGENSQLIRMKRCSRNAKRWRTKLKFSDHFHSAIFKYNWRNVIGARRFMTSKGLGFIIFLYLPWLVYWSTPQGACRNSCEKEWRVRLAKLYFKDVRLTYKVLLLIVARPVVSSTSSVARIQFIVFGILICIYIYMHTSMYLFLVNSM